MRQGARRCGSRQGCRKLDQIAVIGTDGISDAYASIKAGELTATVDSFPVLTGEVAMEVALRLQAGQKLRAWWQPRRHLSPRTPSTATPATSQGPRQPDGRRQAVIAKRDRPDRGRSLFSGR